MTKAIPYSEAHPHSKTAKRKKFNQQLEAELKRRVVGKGTPEEQKRKANWFKKHVIIDMGD